MARLSALCLLLPLSCERCADSGSSEYTTEPVGPYDTGFLNPCEAGATWSTSEIVSPSEGVELTVSPWVPVMVHFDTLEFLANAALESWLDCEPYGDGAGVIRPRADTSGGGLDFLGTLDVLDLEPGEHTLVHHFTDMAGHGQWVGSTFTVTRPANEVTATVTDPEGKPLYARVIVLKDGLPLDLASADGKMFDPKGRDSAISSFFVVDGEGRVRLDDGHYRFVVVRSALDTIDSIEVDLDADTELDFTIARAVETTGFSAGDFHVHTGASVDSFLPDQPRAYSLAAAGLDVVVPADHDQVRNFDDSLDILLGEERQVFVIPGTEATILVSDEATDTGIASSTSYGHLSVFPLDPATVRVNPVVDTTLADYMANFRTAMKDTPFEANTTGILQLNHPRGIQMRPDLDLQEIHDLFNKLGFDPASPPGIAANEWMGQISEQDNTTLAFDFDALEVVNRGSWEVYNLTRLDWLSLLNWGRRITGTGNSDSHALAFEVAGFPVNLVPCAPPKPGGTVDIACWVQALRGGRVSVTNGPLVGLVLNHQKVAHGVGDFFTRNTQRVQAEVRIQAAPWMPVAEVRLIINGEVAETVAVTDKERKEDGSLDVTYALNVPIMGRDTYVLAEAGWPLDQPYPKGKEKLLGDFALVVPGYLPLGFTNAVWIDEDGDGAWIPPEPPKKKKK
jgi:hypothetical protein